MHEHPEQEQLPSIIALQTAREEAAELASKDMLRGFFRPGLVTERLTPVTSVSPNDYPFYHDGLEVRLDTLLTLEAVGASRDDVLRVINQEPTAQGKALFTRQLPGERLDIVQDHGGVGYRLERDDAPGALGGDEPSPQLRALLTARLLKSPAHQAFLAAAERVQAFAPDAMPETVATEPFNPAEDPLGTMVFLKDIGLVQSGWAATQAIKDGVPMTEMLAGTIDRINPRNRIEDSDNRMVAAWQGYPGLKTELIIDKQTGMYVLQATRHPIDRWLEKANQSEARSLPFVESACASEVVAFLDRAGLMLHPALQKAMIAVGDADRYGSIYTQLSREIAKWVDTPERFKLSNLFVPRDETMSDRQLVGKSDQEVMTWEDSFAPEELEVTCRQKYLDTAQNGRGEQGEAAAVLFDMIDGVLARQASGEAPQSDLPVTKQYVNMKAGACFDVLSYYVGAAYEAAGLREIQAGTTRLLEKTHGSHTFLSEEPMTFNGVALPKGALFMRADDGGYALQRLTPFAFDEAVDQLAFGSEISKTYANELRACQSLGELCIASLQAAVSYNSNV